jgi:hypothetical protein
LGFGFVVLVVVVLFGFGQDQLGDLRGDDVGSTLFAVPVPRVVEVTQFRVLPDRENVNQDPHVDSLVKVPLKDAPHGVDSGKRTK